VKTLVLEPLPILSADRYDPVPVSKPKATFTSSPRIPADYRLLTETEIQQIVPVFESMGATLPSPVLSTIVGAVKNGRVVGFIVLQLVLHAEPMWIEPGHSEVFNGISRLAQDVVAEKCGGGRVYLFADAEKIARLSDINEFERVDTTVYTKYIPAKVITSTTMDPVGPRTEEDPDPTAEALSKLEELGMDELDRLTRPDTDYFEGGAV